MLSLDVVFMIDNAINSASSLKILFLFRDARLRQRSYFHVLAADSATDKRKISFWLSLFLS